MQGRLWQTTLAASASSRDSERDALAVLDKQRRAICVGASLGDRLMVHAVWAAGMRRIVTCVINLCIWRTCCFKLQWQIAKFGYERLQCNTACVGGAASRCEDGGGMLRPEIVERDFPYIATRRLRKTHSLRCVGSHAGELASGWAGRQNGVLHVRRGFCLLRGQTALKARMLHMPTSACVPLGAGSTPWCTGVCSWTEGMHRRMKNIQHGWGKMMCRTVCLHGWDKTFVPTCCRLVGGVARLCIVVAWARVLPRHTLQTMLWIAGCPELSRLGRMGEVGLHWDEALRRVVGADQY